MLHEVAASNKTGEKMLSSKTIASIKAMLAPAAAVGAINPAELDQLLQIAEAQTAEPAKEAERYLTINEAAALLRRHRKTIHDWIAQGLLVFVRPGGKAVLIPQSSIDALLKNGTGKPLGYRVGRLPKAQQTAEVIA